MMSLVIFILRMLAQVMPTAAFMFYGWKFDHEHDQISFEWAVIFLLMMIWTKE